MSDLKNPHIRAGGNAFEVIRNDLERITTECASGFLDSLVKSLNKYFRTLSCRKASRKNFKRRRW